VSKIPNAKLLLECDDPSTVTHVIASDGTSSIRRTIKLMIGICCTPNIVRMQWLIDSAASGMALPCTDEYLICHDEGSEKMYNMKWIDTLQRSAHNQQNGTPLLHGYCVYVCRGVKPNPNEFQKLIEAAGGQWIMDPSNYSDPTNNNISTTMSQKGKKILYIRPEVDVEPVTSVSSTSTSASASRSKKQQQHEHTPTMKRSNVRQRGTPAIDLPSNAIEKTAVWLFDAIIRQELDLGEK
jgi:hypothetical protein